MLLTCGGLKCRTEVPGNVNFGVAKTVRLVCNRANFKYVYQSVYTFINIDLKSAIVD